MIPKTASAVAAPSPETKPASLPSKTVRRMHMTPTGPTGTAMTMPTTMPFRKNTKSIWTDPRTAAWSVSGKGRKGATRNPAAARTRRSRYAGLETSARSSMTATEDAYRFEFTSIDGDRLAMEDWRGRPVLVVNTASYCGDTPQYSDLQALWRRYRDRGLGVVGGPPHDFGEQEAWAGRRRISGSRSRGRPPRSSGSALQVMR